MKIKIRYYIKGVQYITKDVYTSDAEAIIAARFLVKMGATKCVPIDVE